MEEMSRIGEHRLVIDAEAFHWILELIEYFNWKKLGNSLILTADNNMFLWLVYCIKWSQITTGQRELIAATT